jgi:hypothetical protein
MAVRVSLRRNDPTFDSCKNMFNVPSRKGVARNQIGLHTTKGGIIACLSEGVTVWDGLFVYAAAYADAHNFIYARE